MTTMTPMDRADSDAGGVQDTGSSASSWSRWLLRDRFGGDPASEQRVERELHPVRDRVLRHARLPADGVLLDVGCGDGLIGFGALAQCPSSRVIFSDVSRELLAHVRELATARALAARCRFLHASATDLCAIGDDVIDVVTMRSALLFVDHPQSAFDEFYRVLKPGGRLSMYEGINAYGVSPGPTLFGYDIAPVIDEARKLVAAYFEHVPPTVLSRMAFDERDLLRFAEAAGFREVHLELGVELSRRPATVSWDVFRHTRPHPDFPSLASAIERALAPAEAERFVTHLRRQFEQASGAWRTGVAYLWAVK